MTGNYKFDQLVQEPIFIIGAARSGTTWVLDILTAHPEVTGIHESWLFTQNNGLFALFTSAHWPPKRSGLGRLLGREELIKYTRNLATQIMSHAIKPGHRYLVEKSPHHLFVIPFINEIFPEAKFIHVLRDGRDVSVSVRAASKSWEPDWRKTFGRSIKSAARAWKHAVKSSRKSGENLNNRFLEIRYEEIYKDPFDTYRRLFDFCEIPYDDGILQSAFNATDFSKNYKPNEIGFRRKGKVGDWRTHFNLIDALIFNLEAGKMLIELGYEKNRRWFPYWFNRQ
ncbi:MAG: sulfotransferase [Deltaproteobacteria bacterium]|nr:sulfotransferase [Deltaproteobacteria bacterium]